METGKSVVLFDGYCNLCDGVVKFLIKHDHKKQFIFIPLQSRKGKELVQQVNVPENFDAVILITNENTFTASDAVLEIARNLPFPWKMAFVFRYIPKPFRDGIYRFIASKRYRWWGKRNECNIEQNQ
jgi:predicted DCC family thiol-disulfide oxidoreductase YuxK